MRKETCMKLTCAVLAVVLTFFAGVSWGSSQAAQSVPVPPTILSGADIGFRIQSRNGETPVGTLVVRVDGKWVVPQYAMGVKPLTTK
jgi:hypothetical protein